MEAKLTHQPTSQKVVGEKEGKKLEKGDDYGFFQEIRERKKYQE